MNSIFRKQKIFNINEKVVEKEYLYKNIPELVEIQNDIKNKIIMDLLLLENFLLEDNNKDLDTVSHFNINLETILYENEKVYKTFRKYVTDNKRRVLEILEDSRVDRGYKFELGDFQNLKSLQEKLNIEYSLDDFPRGSSSFDNMKNNVISRVKVDRFYWNCIYEKYNRQDKLNVLKRILEAGIQKAIKNDIKFIVIEGIATKEQWEFIKKINSFDKVTILGQGHYLHVSE